jgi:pilus assembly protein Flp/PilA
MSKIIEFLKDECGAAAAEYVLIVAVMGAAIAAGATVFGNDLSSALGDIGTALTTKTSGITF